MLSAAYKRSTVLTSSSIPQIKTSFRTRASTSFRLPLLHPRAHTQTRAMSYSKLLSPVTVGSVPLRNRVVMSALTRDRSQPTNVPNDVSSHFFSMSQRYSLLVSEGQPGVLHPARHRWCWPNRHRGHAHLPSRVSHLASSLWLLKMLNIMLRTEWQNAPGIWSKEHVEGWKRITTSVHEHGGKIFNQVCSQST